VRAGPHGLSCTHHRAAEGSNEHEQAPVHRPRDCRPRLHRRRGRGCSSSSKGSTSSSTVGAANAAASSAATTPSPTTATSAAAATSLDLSGKWSGHYGGSFTGTFSLNWQQSSGSLTGNISISNPSQNLSLTGTLTGTTISFGTVGGQAITYTGTASANSMSGTYSVAGRAAGNWSASKSG
jgi:hypothetical protein